MAEASRKKKRSEEDVTELLQRYTATTIISLLQEVSDYTIKHSDCVKINWKTLVKNTCTGICNAREYQMLWRHLAYQFPLLDKVEDGAEPLDDDSDLEFELEAVPPPNPEDSTEVEEYTKVILSSVSSHICVSSTRSALEASATIDAANGQGLLDSSEKLSQLTNSSAGASSAVPVSAQKQPLPPGMPNDGLDGNGNGNGNDPGLPAKKKRQLWTKEEDIELIAAVQKCGEGNWANILKGDFKHNRTASQLSQRWTLLRKRLANSNQGNGSKVSSSSRSEERLAAQKAFSLAVDMPITGSVSALFSAATQTANSSTSSAATSQASRASAAKSLNTGSISKKTGTLGKPFMGPSPSIQAAAFAAGGRIANPSTALSLFRAAQSKNAVHIRPLPISSTISSSKPSAVASSSVTTGLRPIRPSVPSTSFGTTLSALRSSQTATATRHVPNGSTTVDMVEGTSLEKNVAGKSNNVGGDASDIDVEELLSEDVGGGTGQSQTAVDTKDQPEKAESSHQALVTETKIFVGEAEEKGSAEDDCADSRTVGEKESYSESRSTSAASAVTAEDSRSIVDRQPVD